MDEKERLMFAARTAGIGEEEARQRIEKLLLEQRDRFELAWATEAGEPVESLIKWRQGDLDYRGDAYYLRGAWRGWKLHERLTGNDPFMGFILEDANEGELAAYDYGCRSCEDAVRRVIEGDDKGDGAANEPWNSLRNQLLRLKTDAERWRKMNRMSFNGAAFRAVVISPSAVSQEEHNKYMNEWIDRSSENPKSS